MLGFLRCGPEWTNGIKADSDSHQHEGKESCTSGVLHDFSLPAKAFLALPSPDIL